MDWVQFQESLIDEGYKSRPTDFVTEKVIREATCPVCNQKALIPCSYTNSNNEYVCYQLCGWCDYYGEV